MCPPRGGHEKSHETSFLRSGRLIPNKRQSTMEIYFFLMKMLKDRKYHPFQIYVP